MFTVNVDEVVQGRTLGGRLGNYYRVQSGRREVSVIGDALSAVRYAATGTLRIEDPLAIDNDESIPVALTVAENGLGMHRLRDGGDHDPHELPFRDATPATFHISSDSMAHLVHATQAAMDSRHYRALMQLITQSWKAIAAQLRPTAIPRRTLFRMLDAERVLDAERMTRAPDEENDDLPKRPR